MSNNPINNQPMILHVVTLPNNNINNINTNNMNMNMVPIPTTSTNNNTMHQQSNIASSPNMNMNTLNFNGYQYRPPQFQRVQNVSRSSNDSVGYIISNVINNNQQNHINLQSLGLVFYILILR